MKKLFLSFLFLIVLNTIPAWATTWYVRDGGGNLAQCNGTTNQTLALAVGGNCAYNHPRYVMGWGCTSGGLSCSGGSNRLAAGDTLFIDGDSDLTPGTQAQYMIGYDSAGSGALTPGCSSSFPYDCTLGNIPAGTSTSVRTSIIGTGTHKPQFWGNQRPWQVVNASNNHIVVQWLEITDHSNCGYAAPVNACNYGGSYPFGPYGMDGMLIGGDDVNLTDVYIHGMAHYGMNTNNFGSATFTRVWVIGNTWAGISTGTAAVISGTMTFNQPIIEWTGCEEAYPLASAGIDNPLNYNNCFGQNSGGYGDGLAFGNDGNGNAGNWTITGPGSISFNVQDGLDTLHGNGNGTIQIDKMRFEGNGGNQIKINALNGYLTNSVVFANCGWWYQSAQAASGAMTPGDSCRAEGDAIVYVTSAASGNTDLFYNNTIVGNGNIVFLQDGSCDSSDHVTFKNNIVYGGYVWIDDTAIIGGGGGNSQTHYIYNGGTDGNGTGCSGIVQTEDYNIVTGTSSSNAGCTGTHDKCGTNPLFTGTVPVGTSGGGLNTYYQGSSGVTLIPISGGSPAIGSGSSGLTFWNTPNDYYNEARPTLPAMGAEEVASCGINAYGCFFNSDCCSGTCTGNACTGAACSANNSTCLTGSQCCNSFCCANVCGGSTCQSNPSSSLGNFSFNGSLGR